MGNYYTFYPFRIKPVSVSDNTGILTHSYKANSPAPSISKVVSLLLLLLCFATALRVQAQSPSLKYCIPKVSIRYVYVNNVQIVKVNPDGSEVTVLTKNSSYNDGQTPGSTLENGYSDFTNIKTESFIKPGDQLIARITATNTASCVLSPDVYAKVYVDWNHSGSFEQVAETNERVCSTPTATLPEKSFTVPANAKQGKIRLRIVAASSNNHATSCATNNSETEDYNLVIPATPVASFSYEPPTCVNEGIIFKNETTIADYSTDLQYQWQVSKEGSNVFGTRDENLTFTFPEAGDWTVSLTATSPSNGNTTHTISKTVAVKAVPDKPVITHISEDRGFSDRDGITSDNTLVLYGTSTPGSTVTVTQVGKGSLSTVGTDADGKWHLNIGSSPLAEGEYTFFAVATTGGSCTSIASEIFKVTVDNTPPAEPEITAISGDPDGDGITNSNRLILSGRAPANERVRLFMTSAVETTDIGIRSVSADGSWIYDYSHTDLADGTYILSAKTEDLAGNSSGVSPGMVITIDTKKPEPTLLIGEPAPPGSDFTILVSFDEPVKGLALEGFSLLNGVPLQLNTVDNINYTLKVRPLREGGNEEVHIELGVGAATDKAGNVSKQASIIYDPTRPYPSLSTKAGKRTKAPFVATIVFSFPVRDFEMGSLDVINGSLSNFTSTGDNRTFSVLVTPANDGDVSLQVPVNAAYSLENGKANMASAKLTVVYDVSRPSVEVTSSASEVVSAPFPLQIRFSENVSTTFESRDIKVEGGHVQSFIPLQLGKLYDVEIVPTREGIITVDIQENAAEDEAKNGNYASVQLMRLYDKARPTVTLSADGITHVNGAFTVIFTFNEVVNGFTKEDVIGNNCTVESLVAVNEYVYQARVRPVDGLPDGHVITVQLAAEAVVDVAQNTNLASKALTRLFDKTGPTVDISTPTTGSFVTGPFYVSFQFSEDVTDFVAGKIMVGNGKVAGLLAVNNSKLHFTALIEPDVEGEVTVEVIENAVRDAATNGNSASARLTRIYDLSQPTVNLKSNISGTYVKEAFEVTFTFSENVMDFTSDDIVVMNGTLSGFNQVSSQIYSALITPLKEGEVALYVPARVAQDDALRDNQASLWLKHTYDASAPRGYVLNFDRTSFDATNADEVALRVSGAENDATYHYTITSESGGSPLKGSGKVTQVAFVISSLNLLSLPDGKLTAALYLEDAAGNTGESALASITKLTPNLASIQEPEGKQVLIGTRFDQLGLPGKVRVTYNTSATEEVPVNWLVDDYDAGAATLQEIKGQVTLPAGRTNTDNKLARIKVEVKHKPYVVSVQNPAAKEVLLGTTFSQLNLPVTVNAVFSDGTSEPVGVVWQQVSYNSTATGEYHIKGDLVLQAGKSNANGLQALAVVNVYQKPNVVSVQAFATKKVLLGTQFSSLELPTEAEVIYTYGPKESVQVNWLRGEYDETMEGTYQLVGNLAFMADKTNTNNKQAVIQVQVYRNQAPTAIALSNIRFSAAISADEAIGTFGTTDADDTEHTYSLVAGAGDAHNGIFEIRGDKLHYKSAGNTAGRTSFEVRVRSADTAGNFKEQSFSLIMVALPIAEIVHHPAPKEVKIGTSVNQLDLPGFVRVTFSDGTSEEVAVGWNTAGFDSHTVGTYTLNGELKLASGKTNTNGLVARITVTVRQKPDVSAVQTFAALRVPVGTAFNKLQLPTKADVVFTYGPVESVLVNWQPTGYDHTKAGSYELKGNLTLLAGQTNTRTVQPVIEVEVYEVQVPDIASVQPLARQQVALYTRFDRLALPAKVTVVYDDQTTEDLAVSWRKADYDSSKVTVQEIKGSLLVPKNRTNTKQKEAVVKVEVLPNQAPTALLLDRNTFRPDIGAHVAIGSFSTTDADDALHTYSLVAGEGDADNNFFEIRGSSLYLKAAAQLKGQESFRIRVRSTDGHHNALEINFNLMLANANPGAPVAETDPQEMQLTNVFTPDGDGANDTWQLPELSQYEHVEIEVFDRSGQRVYYSTNPMQGWDGKGANGQIQKGAYFYLVKVKDVNLVKKGVVTVLKK